MRFLPRARLGRSVTDEATDIIGQSSTAGGGTLTAIVSGFALIFSGVSLYQTVLKQPALQLYVPPVIHYARDQASNYEIFAVPVTIANHGARDGTVLSLDLNVKREGSAVAKDFYSAYFVEGEYFEAPPGVDRTNNIVQRPKRPKAPFAPISVAGRTAYSGTILFYKKISDKVKVVEEKGTFALSLKINTRLDESLGFFDTLWRSKTRPVNFRSVLPYYSRNALLYGETIPMNNADWVSPVGEAISKSRSAE